MNIPIFNRHSLILIRIKWIRKCSFIQFILHLLKFLQMILLSSLRHLKSTRQNNHWLSLITLPIIFTVTIMTIKVITKIIIPNAIPILLWLLLSSKQINLILNNWTINGWWTGKCSLKITKKQESNISSRLPRSWAPTTPSPWCKPGLRRTRQWTVR